MIISDLPSEIASTDDAFVSAITPKNFGEIALAPYSLMRQMAAVEICGDNPHPITAVIVHIWVCTRDDKEVSKARLNRVDALSEAFSWAEANGVKHPGAPAMHELINLYNRIDAELHASTQLMPADNGREPKNAGGLPG